MTPPCGRRTGDTSHNKAVGARSPGERHLALYHYQQECEQAPHRFTGLYVVKVIRASALNILAGRRLWSAARLCILGASTAREKGFEGPAHRRRDCETLGEIGCKGDATSWRRMSKSIEDKMKVIYVLRRERAILCCEIFLQV